MTSSGASSPVRGKEMKVASPSTEDLRVLTTDAASRLTVDSSLAWFEVDKHSVATQTSPEASPKNMEQGDSRMQAAATLSKQPGVSEEGTGNDAFVQHRPKGEPRDSAWWPPFKAPPMPFIQFEALVQPLVLKRPPPKPPSSAPVPLTAAKMPSSEPSSRVIVSKAIPLSLMLSLGLDSKKVPEAQQRGDSSAPGALGTATDLAENEGFIPEVHSPSDSSSQMDVPLTTKQPWLSRGKANAAFTVALSTTRTGWPVNLAMHRIIGETSGTQQDPPPCGPGRTVRWNPSFGKWPD